MAVAAVAIHHRHVPYLAWTGFYVGINGGYAWGNSSVTFAPNDPAALAGTCGGGGAPKGQCINSVDFRRDGAVAGGQFGFNWQVNSHWLVGARSRLPVVQSRRLGEFAVPARQCRRNQHGREPDRRIVRDGSSAGRRRARAAALALRHRRLRVRSVHENLSVPAGRAPSGLTAGGFSYACTVGTACFAGSASQTLFGWTAGAGAEYAITTNLIFRTELLYVHLSSPTVTATATAVAAGTAPASIAASFSPVYFAVMRAGLNYRF